MADISSTNMAISDIFNTTFDQVHSKGQELKKRMSEISGKTLSTEEMLQLQFEMGEYNTMLEALSTVTKALVDETKSLAQRSN